MSIENAISEGGINKAEWNSYPPTSWMVDQEDLAVSQEEDRDLPEWNYTLYLLLFIIIAHYKRGGSSC